LSASGLDHRNALAIDGRHEDGTTGRFRGAFPIKGVKVQSRILQDFL
jgi:hypothetical protein